MFEDYCYMQEVENLKKSVAETWHCECKISSTKHFFEHVPLIYLTILVKSLGAYNILWGLTSTNQKFPKIFPILDSKFPIYKKKFQNFQVRLNRIVNNFKNSRKRSIVLLLVSKYMIEIIKFLYNWLKQIFLIFPFFTIIPNIKRAPVLN